MNIKLRKRHRWLTLTMAVAAPVLALSAVLVREVVPEDDLAVLENSSVTQLADSFELVPFSPDWPVGVGLTGEQLFIEASDQLLGPDILIYWTEGGSDESAGLFTRDALGIGKGLLFLGQFKQTEPTLIDLPEDFSAKRGQLNLISLVTRETLAVSSVMEVSE